MGLEVEGVNCNQAGSPNPPGLPQATGSIQKDLGVGSFFQTQEYIVSYHLKGTHEKIILNFPT